MGTVHKFKPPPKNERQFRGYRPDSRIGPAKAKPRRRQLHGWQRGTLAWLVLVLVAVGFWAVGRLF